MLNQLENSDTERVGGSNKLVDWLDVRANLRGLLQSGWH